MGRKADLIGMRFGRLIVIAEDGRNNQGGVMWICKCDCGGENRLSTSTLNRGLVKSCGCIKAELDKTRTRLHGLSDTKAYSRYLSMIRRCTLKSDPAYPFYGAKGIKVCDRWLESNGQGFLNYIEDMGEKPSEDYSVDRIDPLGDYSPENCRWADKHTQAVNQDIRKNNTSGRTGVIWDKRVRHGGHASP